MTVRVSKIFILFLTVTVATLLAGIWWRSPSATVASHPVETVASTNPPAVAAMSSQPHSNALAQTFTIAETTPTHRWASADARDTNVIRQLAHNDLEYARMVGENPRVQRRQLVYRTDPAAAVIQRAKLSGAPITRLTLPGLDGREIEFEIRKADLNPSGQQGTFTGVVAGQADSMVTLSFKGRREAFTIELPAEKTYLLAEPHELGEVVVKKIDPETYVPGVCGNP